MRTLNLLAFMPLAPRMPLYGRLLWALATDPRVPGSRKALLGIAALYVISPWDLVPDRLPLIGGLDDVVVVVLAVDAFLEGMPVGLIDEKLAELDLPRAELEDDLRRVRRAVPRSVRMAAARVPDALDGIAAFVKRSGLERRFRDVFEGKMEADMDLEELPA
jgi:uncharacterized membrane protein YkvA (DUF1232 family)